MYGTCCGVDGTRIAAAEEGVGDLVLGLISDGGVAGWSLSSKRWLGVGLDIMSIVSILVVEEDR
jgi:hypothetical protein